MLQSAVIRDAQSGDWLRFTNPASVLLAMEVEQVRPLLEEAERAVASEKWVAGFLSYEAASAFDSALRTKPAEGLPLMALGVFEAPERISSPGPFMDGPVPIARPQLPDQTAYAARVGAILEAIGRGDLYQANLTYQLEALCDGDPTALHRYLLTGGAATYGAYLDLGNVKVCSASPELFFRLEGNRLQSRPMKGTRPRAGGSAAGLALSASEKDRAENLMIVDMVRNDLSRVCIPGSVVVPRLWDLEAYPSVWQLTSVVEGQTDAGLAAIMGALFPAASITGAPKAAAMTKIESLESGPRGVYTGAIGFAAPGRRAQFSVAIRTAVLDSAAGRLSFGTGGGIVADSTPQDEWEETHAKAAILQREAPVFDLVETMRWEPGRGVLRLDLHRQRLAASAAGCGFAFDAGAFGAAIADAVCPAPEMPMRIRLTLSRAGHLAVTVQPIPGDGFEDNPIVELARARVASADPLLGIKTTDRRLYADILGLSPEAHDVLLWNERGEITESTLANVFVESEGRLLTPPRRSGLIPGTLREEMLRNGRATERVILARDLTPATRLWLANSVRGLYPVREYRTGPEPIY